jgi:hypothetical protein
VKCLFWAAVVSIGTASAAYGGSGAADIASEIRLAGLNPEECYRVREVNFSKEDARLYLTEGYLIFAKPIGGRRLGAIFTAETEGGDAEILLMPPTRSERASLASFTGSPNLTEHFRMGAMIFTDGTGEHLIEQLQSLGSKKEPETGILLAQRWDALLRNFLSSFEVRLVHESFRPATPGFFYAALTGNKLGNFDLIYDPRAREQITIGQVSSRGDRPVFDTWASFEARSFRSGKKTIQSSDFDLSDFRIDVTVHPDLRITASTQVKLIPRKPGERAFAFDISKRVRVTSASVDGKPAEVFHRDSLRAGLLRGGDNDVFLLVAADPLEAGRSYEVEFLHEGNIVRSAGSNVLFVEARANWYPHRNLQFARYDLTFRYPKELALVSTGEVIDDREDGLQRITRRRTESPIRMAGFNLGDYEKAEVSRGSFKVEVYANRKLETALQPKPREYVMLPPPFPRTQARRQIPSADAFAIPVQPAIPSPTARLQKLAGEVSAAFEFMAKSFGPPPLPSLTVSPIPAAFGQGFPGLVYLSTLSYLEERERPASLRNPEQQTFFSELLPAHETAHQWWGNSVTSLAHQDEWLMESLANYSALLFAERQKGPRILDSVLDTYVDHLLTKRPDGETVESTGPLSWGVRLQTSQLPGSWRTIIYEKGSWVIHMLRRRLGDERFFSFLTELAKRYQFKAITTDEFRELAVEFVPKGDVDPSLENFFDHWVHGTGIPSLRLQYSVRGKAPNLKLAGTLVQTGVSEDFSVDVPIEIQLGKQKRVVWVRSSSEPVPWAIALKQAPSKVLLDPARSVLAIRK